MDRTEHLFSAILKDTDSYFLSFIRILKQYPQHLPKALVLFLEGVVFYPNPIVYAQELLERE